MSIPKGLTLIEVMIAILIAAVISIMSMRVITDLNLSQKKIHDYVMKYQSLSDIFRLLENDVRANQIFLNNSLSLKINNVEGFLLFPDGTIWEWENGYLYRSKKGLLNKKKLFLSNEIDRLEITVWQGSKFVDILSPKKNDLRISKITGIKASVIQLGNIKSEKIFVLKGSKF